MKLEPPHLVRAKWQLLISATGSSALRMLRTLVTLPIQRAQFYWSDMRREEDLAGEWKPPDSWRCVARMRWLLSHSTLRFRLGLSWASYYDRRQTSFLENKLWLTTALFSFASFTFLCTLMQLNIKCLLRCCNYNF